MTTEFVCREEAFGINQCRYQYIIPALEWRVDNFDLERKHSGFRGHLKKANRRED